MEKNMETTNFKLRPQASTQVDNRVKNRASSHNRHKRADGLRPRKKKGQRKLHQIVSTTWLQDSKVSRPMSPPPWSQGKMGCQHEQVATFNGVWKWGRLWGRPVSGHWWGWPEEAMPKPWGQAYQGTMVVRWIELSQSRSRPRKGGIPKCVTWVFFSQILVHALPLFKMLRLIH